MKKKIIFMIINMNIGGTEKALLNMISVMPKEEFDITILMLEEYGGFLDSIPEGVHLKYINGYEVLKELRNKPPQLTALTFLKRRRIVKAINVLFFHLLAKIFDDRSIYFKYILHRYPVMNDYDVAVAYAGPIDFITYFVLKKIRAKRKIQWIHFDITKIGFNRDFVTKFYKDFDDIFVVSSEGKDKFTEMLPCLKDKVKTFPNIISPKLVKKLANEGDGFTDNFDGIRILTVGRLSKEKGQDLTIPVLAQLKKDGYNVRWYCVGEGGARLEYEQLIQSYGLEDDYILLGSNPNPYPFMKQCDLYVQPSRHEGFCITIAEAKCFNRPIISTNFTGACEQIHHEQTGLIVDFNKEQLAYAIKRLIDNETLRNTIEGNLQKDMDEIQAV